jgi:maleamate amidohydrolase
LSYDEAPAEIWEPFLTERDRKHIALVGNPQRRGMGEAPCLLLVDNYRGVLGDRPQELLSAVQHLPMSTGVEGWQAIERIQILLERARSLGWPVIHTTGLGSDESGMPSWYRGRGATLAASQTGPGITGSAASYEIVDEVAPVDGEPVIKKAGPSAFGGTPLAKLLVSLRVDTIIIAGETTSGCIRSTVADACGTYGYRVIVPAECVYDRHQASHAMSLFDMNEKYADVVTLNSLLTVIDEISR